MAPPFVCLVHDGHADLALELRCPEEAVAGWYGDALGLRSEGSTVQVGEAEMVFVPGPGRPFYHFALLVPGDRFDAAHAWLGSRVDLLAGADGYTVFDFGFWDARACYFHDPAGNIAELIAHRGVAERSADGPFSPAELAGISEIGVVAADIGAVAGAVDLELWSGAVGGPDDLGFLGRRAHTLVLPRPAGPGSRRAARPSRIRSTSR